MKKIRINELARELEVKAHEILDRLPELGVAEKKTHSSSIDEDVAIKLRRLYGFDVPDMEPESEPENAAMQETHETAVAVEEPPVGAPAGGRASSRSGSYRTGSPAARGPADPSARAPSGHGTPRSSAHSRGGDFPAAAICATFRAANSSRGGDCARPSGPARRQAPTGTGSSRAAARPDSFRPPATISAEHRSAGECPRFRTVRDHARAGDAPRADSAPAS
jgi:translation initiation factor IF-2